MEWLFQAINLLERFTAMLLIFTFVTYLKAETDERIGRL